MPDIVVDIAKESLANHHPRAAWPVMFEPNETWVAVFRVKVGPGFRQDVSVQVDFHSRFQILIALRPQEKRKPAENSLPSRVSLFIEQL